MLNQWLFEGKFNEEVRSAREAMEIAGLDWQVRVEEIESYKTVSGKTIDVPDFLPLKHLVIRDDSAVLGTVGKRYRVVQNVSAFDFFDSIVESGKATYESAGSFEGGRVVWLCAKITDDALIAGKDKIKRYILLLNSHNGRFPVSAMLIPWRVVCSNMLSFSIGFAKRKGVYIKARHTEMFSNRFGAAQRIFKQALNEYLELEKVYAQMALRKMTKDELLEYANNVIELSKAESSLMKSMREKRRDEIVEYAYSSPGCEMFPGTLWNAYNAAVRFADILVEQRNEKTGVKSANTLFYGGSSYLKDRAFVEAQRMLSL